MAVTVVKAITNFKHVTYTGWLNLFAEYFRTASPFFHTGLFMNLECARMMIMTVHLERLTRHNSSLDFSNLVSWYPGFWFIAKFDWIVLTAIVVKLDLFSSR